MIWRWRLTGVTRLGVEGPPHVVGDTGVDQVLDQLALFSTKKDSVRVSEDRLTVYQELPVVFSVAL